jgi:hypothetical protein
LVSAAAGESATTAEGGFAALRRRLGRMLDTVSDADDAEAEAKRRRSR